MQVKAGSTFVEVPKPSLPIRLPPPPKGPAPLPADDDCPLYTIPIEPPPSLPYGDYEPLDAPGPHEYSYRGPLKEAIPPRTRSNPEQVPVLRPYYSVKPTPHDCDRLDMSVMHSQDDALEPLNNDLAHAKAHASSALGGAALRGSLEQVLQEEQQEYSVEEEKVQVEEDEEEEQGAAPSGAPAPHQDQPPTEGSSDAEAAASGAEPFRPVVMTPGPGAFMHRHLTSFRLRRTQWDREHEPTVSLDEARDRVYDLDWSNVPETEGDQLHPPRSKSIQGQPSIA